MRPAHDADSRFIDIGKCPEIGQRRIGVGCAAEGGHVVSTRRRVSTNTTGMAARGEAIGHNDGVSVLHQFPGPAHGRAARTGTEPAAIVHDHDRGERPRPFRFQHRRGDLHYSAVSGSRGKRKSGGRRAATRRRQEAKNQNRKSVAHDHLPQEVNYFRIAGRHFYAQTIRILRQSCCFVTITGDGKNSSTSRSLFCPLLRVFLFLVLSHAGLHKIGDQGVRNGLVEWKS